MLKPRNSTIHDPRYRCAVQVLIRARKSAKLSQSDLAQAVGFTQPDISKIERLERRLDITEFLDVIYAISGGDKLIISRIWNEVDECHNR